MRAARIRCEAEDAEYREWKRMAASMADKARAARKNGDPTKAKVLSHMAKVAANAREQVYVSFLLAHHLI